MRPINTLICTIALSFSAFAQTNTIATFAGTPPANGILGDAGPATAAQLNAPDSVAVDSAGNVYIADTLNAKIRLVSNGVITTIAGTGSPGFNGEGGLAINAQLGSPVGIAVDSSGSVYVADGPNNRIRKIAGGFITTVAGGTPGFGGDGGLATSASLNFPSGVAVDSAGNIYIADTGNHRIRKVSGGIITTIAGNSSIGFTGDNIPAATSGLYSPRGVAVDSQGNLYIADTGDNLIRKVSGGIITTVAGVGSAGYSGDFGPATAGQLNLPGAVAADGNGNVYVADTGNNVIRKISGSLLSTVAGNGTAGFSGDLGPAVKAQLTQPMGLGLDSSGAYVYIADTGNNAIRLLTTSVPGGVIPHFAAGSTYITGFYVVNKSAASASFALNFYDDNGKSVNVPVKGQASGSSIADTVPALGANYYEIGDPASATLLSGSVAIQFNPSIVVQAIFRHQSTGGAFFEAAVPSSPGSTEVELAFDATVFPANGAQIYTGVALANIDSSSPATVTCVARDGAGAVIPAAITVPVLKPLGHWADYNFPALLGKRGTLDCTSNTKIGALALRFLGTDAITTLPVILK